MAAKLIVTVVVIPLHRCILDRAVHPFDLTVCPRMIWLGQPVLDTVRLADQIEAHLAGCHAVPVPRLLCKLDAVIRQDCVDMIWHCFEQMLQKLPCCFTIGFLNKLGDRELAGSVNGNKQMQLPFLSPDLGDIDVEITDWISLELLPLRLVAFHIRQSGYPVPLKTTMQRRPRQMRDRWLQGIEAIIQWQQSMTTERNHHRLFFLAENG